MSSGSPFQRAPGAEYNKSFSLEGHEEGQVGGVADLQQWSYDATIVIFDETIWRHW